jgi:hypothetical protein
MRIGVLTLAAVAVASPLITNLAYRSPSRTIKALELDIHAIHEEASRLGKRMDDSYTGNVTFPYGVASGDPEKDSVILWTMPRKLDLGGELYWTLASMVNDGLQQACMAATPTHPFACSGRSAPHPRTSPIPAWSTTALCLPLKMFASASRWRRLVSRRTRSTTTVSNLAAAPN